LGYAGHCGNWLEVLEQLMFTTKVKLVHINDLTQFLSSIGYTDVKTHNNTSESDYVVRLKITIPSLNKRFTTDILPQLDEYVVIKDHLANEIQIYNRLMLKHARSQV
jgi:hypothetical protein